MKGLFFSSLSEQIGFALLHSLWQALIGVLFMLLISRLVNVKYSSLRYWLYTGIMGLVFAVNIFTFSNQILGQGGVHEFNMVANLVNSIGTI